MVFDTNTHLSAEDIVIWMSDSITAQTPADPCANATQMPIDKAEDPSVEAEEDHGGRLLAGPSGLLQHDVILLGGVDGPIGPDNLTLNVTAYPTELLPSSSRYQ